MDMHKKVLCEAVDSALAKGGYKLDPAIVALIVDVASDCFDLGYAHGKAEVEGRNGTRFHS